MRRGVNNLNSHAEKIRQDLEKLKSIAIRIGAVIGMAGIEEPLIC